MRENSGGNQDSRGVPQDRGLLDSDPTDVDVEECIVQVLKTIAIGATVDFEYIKLRVINMVNGVLRERHLVDRMIALRSRKQIVLVKERPGKKCPSTYRLSTPTDFEKPKWPTQSSS